MTLLHACNHTHCKAVTTKQLCFGASDSGGVGSILQHSFLNGICMHAYWVSNRYVFMFIPDVPGFVFDVLQTQELWDFDWRQSVSDIHLVSEEQDGDPPVFNVCGESERDEAGRLVLESSCWSCHSVLPCQNNMCAHWSIIVTLVFTECSDKFILNNGERRRHRRQLTGQRFTPKFNIHD